MTTMETICSRASVRSYTGEPVSPEELAIILKAAKASPAGMARFDTLHLTVIHNPDLLAEIDAAGAALFGDPTMHPLYGAPTLVVVSSRKPAPGMENVAYSNAAIMVHSMALAATDLGVGSCYIWGATAALSKSEAILAKLGLPEDFIPCCAITLGKTDVAYTLREIPDDKISSNTIE
ncbi:MAG: nitroreductase family protein [Ruminiclostridium sp.]|nr:nitroreductase family protein [Ruminiclostridium sp.]